MSEIAQDSNVSIFSKNEKKARELILKLGLKPIQGVSRVTFKKKDGQIFAIDRPEVYKSQGGNFVVFGEAKVDDFTQRLAKAQESLQQNEGVLPAGQDAVSKDPQSIQADMQAAADSATDKPSADDAADDAEVDETGLNADDIELVMQQAGVPRAKAAKALKEHDSDIVNAIMALSG
ncbi:Egd2 [Kluyveromyces lactis]|nr:Egd2 [Kluyveromyces lactis]